MAGIFEQPRNAGTLCELLSYPLLWGSKLTSFAQSLEGRKLAVPTFESRMVGASLAGQLLALELAN